MADFLKVWIKLKIFIFFLVGHQAALADPVTASGCVKLLDSYDKYIVGKVSYDRRVYFTHHGVYTLKKEKALQDVGRYYETIFQVARIEQHPNVLTKQQFCEGQLSNLDRRARKRDAFTTNSSFHCHTLLKEICADEHSLPSSDLVQMVRSSEKSEAPLFELISTENLYFQRLDAFAKSLHLFEQIFADMGNSTLGNQFEALADGLKIITTDSKRLNSRLNTIVQRGRGKISNDILLEILDEFWRYHEDIKPQYAAYALAYQKFSEVFSKLPRDSDEAKFVFKLNSTLITPIQRVMRYVLQMKEVEKEMAVRLDDAGRADLRSNVILAEKLARAVDSQVNVQGVAHLFYY